MILIQYGKNIECVGTLLHTINICDAWYYACKPQYITNIKIYISTKNQVDYNVNRNFLMFRI